MKNNHPLIRDLIHVPEVKTVIRLEDGRRDPQNIISNFVFTSEVTNHFTVLTEALKRNTGQGYFLQGDFGSGKSHFLAVLDAWILSAPGSGDLSNRHKGIDTLRKSERRFLPVSISLVEYRASTPIEQIIISTIEKRLSELGIEVHLSPLAAFLEHLQELCRDETLAGEFAIQCNSTVEEIKGWISANPRDAFTAGTRFIRSHGLPEPRLLLEDRHETFQKALGVIRKEGFDGMVLIIDELSEFFRSKPDTRRLNEDARTLQFLGELSSTQPLWIVASVQESLERTGDIAQVTFRKIKDRFPFRMTLSTLHIRDLLSKRLVHHRDGADEEIYKIYSTFRDQFSTFSFDFDHFRDVYPVHPVTLSLLEGLSDLFSEHRGIVDFVYTRIAGDSRRHVPGILDRPGMELLAPDSIYEHFSERLAEFSDFNIYPRHIVPHFDEIIDRVFDDPGDSELARRLIRILVLYTIHPAAEPPPVGQLTELVACVLAPQQPELSVQFISEAILDPLANESPFLIRESRPEDPFASLYRLTSRADPGKTLNARIDKASEEYSLDDSRLLSAILSEIPESISWPGPAIWSGPVERAITWRNSTRTVLVAASLPGEEKELREKLVRALENGTADFSMVITFPLNRFPVENNPGIAVWRLATPEDPDYLLRRWVAARQVLEELRPGNPADTALIEPAKETIKQITPSAEQASLDAVYAGSFEDSLPIEPMVRQFKRFDRLLECAGVHLLEKRYPRFSEIAPRGVQPSPRLYQRLLDEVILPGSISLQEARRQHLTSAIEGLAAPMGLIEVRSGAYIFSADIQSHPLLSYFNSLLRPAEPTPIQEILRHAQTGKFGLPSDMITFLLAALACGGLISLIRNGRSIPFDFLQWTSVEKADAVAPGEVINADDRGTLVSECIFLSEGKGWESFGLKQQREAWQTAIKFKKKAQDLIIHMASRLKEIGNFSAFSIFDLPLIEQKLLALEEISSSIKISFAAREGLERFLAAWRKTGISHDDIVMLQKLHTFFEQRAEQLIFIHHYLRHPAIKAAAELNNELTLPYRDLISFLNDSEGLISDDGSMLAEKLDRFRDPYLSIYEARHEAYYKRLAGPKPTRFQVRALKLLRRLAAIEILDRPPGLERLLRETEKGTIAVCKRNLPEQLMRSPLCDCSFRLDEEPDPDERSNLEETITRSLGSYLDILRQPSVLEAARARAFAVEDAESESAEGLRRITEGLSGAECSTASLLDMMDERACVELGKSLAGNVKLVHRDMTGLVSSLSGRRLKKHQVKEIVDNWIGAVEPDNLIAMGMDPKETAPLTMNTTDWWPLTHRDLFPHSVNEPGSPYAHSLEIALEQAFPASSFLPSLKRLGNGKLMDFIKNETVHTEAIRSAWRELAERIVTGTGNLDVNDEAYSRHMDSEVSMEICKRTHCLIRLVRGWHSEFPEQLTLRLHGMEIALDEWARDDLVRIAFQMIDRVEQAGQDWLNNLPPVQKIDYEDPGLVVFLDAVSPDVWITAMEGFPENVMKEAEISWMRLQDSPDTVSGITAHFGFSNDPSEDFTARSIPYYQFTGTEHHPLLHMIPGFEDEPFLVIRIACFDLAAHRGAMDLRGMVELLTELNRHALTPLRNACKTHGKRLIITTDHGLSFKNRQLSHGRGGVFERAIFRIEWRPEQV